MSSSYVENTNFKAGVNFEDQPIVYKPYAELNDHGKRVNLKSYVFFQFFFFIL